MSLLTVDVGGPNETVLPFARAGHAEPRTVGKRRYAFAGNERSMIRSEPVIVPLVGDNLPPATVLALRSMFATGAQVYCSGDVFNNGGLVVLCSGELTDEMEQGGTYWIPTLTLHEVSGRTGGVLVGSAAAGGVGSASVALLGPRYSTIGSGGSSSAAASLRVVRAMTASAAGVATTSARTTRQPTSTSAAGSGSVSVTISKV